MTLFVLSKCKKHKQDEEMVIFYHKKMKAYGCFPACRKCMKENKDLIVYKDWKEVLKPTHKRRR